MQHFYVCISCTNQIALKKKPKRNDRDVLQYYDFPEELLAEVRDKCSPSQMLHNNMVSNNNLSISKSLTDECRPNRLENFIFKLVIPFIRIANCKRGRYLKVQGNLIMISSDIDHSLSRILPQKQQIIPV